MKKLLIAAIFAFAFVPAFSQGYEVVREGNSHILKGIISRELVEKDTTYKWYAQNKSGYTPNAEAVSALSQNKDSIQLLVFMGTWCGDSHVIIPKFYSLLDAAGVPPERVTLIGVDRQKKTISHLTEALDVRNVPTIIVYKKGRELGRVVEYGKYGMWDKELGEVIRSSR